MERDHSEQHPQREAKMPFPSINAAVSTPAKFAAGGIFQHQSEYRKGLSVHPIASVKADVTACEDARPKQRLLTRGLGNPELSRNRRGLTRP